MTDEQFRFHLEEYKAVRAELAYHAKLVDDCFIWGTLASGVIAAWLLTNSAQIATLGAVHARLAWFIPFFVGALACAGFYHFMSVIRTMASYLHQLEQALAAPDLGWEAYGRSSPKTSVWLFSRFRFGIAWAVILLADLVLAIFVR